MFKKTMKKTYIAPEAKIYNINIVSHMLEGSIMMTTDAADEDYAGGGDVKGFSNHSVWDTEW